LDINTLSFVGRSVHLSDDEIGSGGEISSELFIHWSHLFAVTAPWSVIFDKDIVLLVLNNLLPLFTDKLEDWLILALWDWLTLEVLLEISTVEIFEKLDHVFGGQVTIENELLKSTLGWVNDPELWEIASDTNVVSEPLVETVNNTGGRHEDATLKLGGSFLEAGRGSIAGLTFLSEKEQTWFSTTEDKLSGFLVEWHDGWNRVGLDESVDVIGGDFTFVVISTFIKLFEETDAGLSVGDIGTKLSGESLISDVVED